MQVDPRGVRRSRESEDIRVRDLSGLPDQIARPQVPVVVHILERKGSEQKCQDQERDQQAPIGEPGPPRMVRERRRERRIAPVSAFLLASPSIPAGSSLSSGHSGNFARSGTISSAPGDDWRSPMVNVDLNGSIPFSSQPATSTRWNRSRFSIAGCVAHHARSETGLVRSSITCRPVP